MNWINAFELLCYAITVMFLWDVIRIKNREEFLLFISAALAGFALELLAVKVTDIYHYSPDFYISIGFRPYQFPFFGGLMWGGLTVYGLRIAGRLKLNDLMTALVTGWLIVTMDLLLDVAAIRLDGGFWVWDGRSITLEITHHMFMSVIWVNFLGYMFETPAMVFISLKTAEKRSKMSFGKQILAAIGIGICGVIFVGAASGISLLLNALTDEWFACIVFILLWCYVLATIVRRCISVRIRISPAKSMDIPVLIYWIAIYGFSIAAMIRLGIAAAVPVYFIFGLLMCAGTLFLDIRE